ncbi:MULTISPECIES: KilA-N domain-containing protein [Acinetobacter]|uniref:KilA-N domain-containing protein n=1 Tax=Acinetobacter TaxID=469 RepID=UPI0009D6D3AC|nr:MULTISPECIES: KilA-N domain-containing protein [Acinetobacter]
MAQSKRTILVNNIEISVSSVNEQDYISLTDMVAGFEGSSALIESWLRNKDTIEFLGVWEQINNHDFNSLEFEGIKNQAGSNRFHLSAKRWIDSVNAIGLVSKAGRYGGTYAHKDIAFEFGSWLSPEFKLYLIKEFQRLKEQEAQVNSIEWQFNRELAKVNYRIQTDAIKEHIVDSLPKPKQGFVYASEADLLNMIVFGQTNKQWKTKNPNLQGNQRDHHSTIENTLLANLEGQNAFLISQGLSQAERYKQLSLMAASQRKSLQNSPAMKKLESQSNLPLLKDIDK